MKINYPEMPVVFLMGPTASGKTALAIELVKSNSRQTSPHKANYEIISVDSAMVYKQMDIGSAKPSADELQIAPHRLIDFRDPKNSYSASEFCEDAIEQINEIHRAGHVPLLVGGTMLYFKALKDGLADLPDTDQQVRNEVMQELADKGIKQLHQQLQAFDPITAERLHPNDRQRITRTIEVYRMTGKPLSQFHLEQQQQSLPNPLLSVALAPEDRAELHLRIKRRFEQMMTQGFLDEVEGLFKRGDLDLDCASMRSVGYRQLWLYLQGELSLSEAVERAIIATRQLAKRQYTWLRGWPDIQWFDPQHQDQKLACIKRIENYSQKMLQG